MFRLTPEDRKRLVVITYTAPQSGEVSVRKIAPLGLRFDVPRRMWVLSAWCVERDMSVEFAFSGISAWAPAEATG